MAVKKKQTQNCFRGFTLIELAIALAIVSLLLGGISVPLSKRIAEQQYAETQASIDKAMEALIGFALLNKRLPCPDISTSTTDNRDGFEDTSAAAGGCRAGANTGSLDYSLAYDATGASWGDLPWKTLGLSPLDGADAWNNRLRYAVVSFFADPMPTLKTNIGTASNTLIVLCSSGSGVAPPGCLASTSYQISNDVAFVVYSVGANGWGGTKISALNSSKPFTSAQLAAAPDEAINAPEKKTGSNAAAITARAQFLTRERTDDANSTSGIYDDLLGYMPKAKLLSRLINAGLYP